MDSFLALPRPPDLPTLLNPLAPPVWPYSPGQPLQLWLRDYRTLIKPHNHLATLQAFEPIAPSQTFNLLLPQLLCDPIFLQLHQGSLIPPDLPSPWHCHRLRGLWMHLSPPPLQLWQVPLSLQFHLGPPLPVGTPQCSKPPTRLLESSGNKSLLTPLSEERAQGSWPLLPPPYGKYVSQCRFCLCCQEAPTRGDRWQSFHYHLSPTHYFSP